MNHQAVALPAGLHVVATPIGAARDITLRALDILASADILVAEDTRSLKKLLTLHGVPLGQRPVWSYHDHTGDKVRDRIVAEVHAGRSVAYASEAGTPLVSDPGFELVRALAETGGRISTAPGPSAVLAALTLAGLPTDRFAFLGFLPPKRGPRTRVLNAFASLPATLVMYEAPKRVQDTLGELCDALGEDRQAVLCREMTKRFEEVIRAPLAALRDQLAGRDLKGECVIAVGPPTTQAADPRDVDLALTDALSRGSLRDAASEIAEVFGIPRKDVYAMALARGSAGSGDKSD
ncbi:16S rRNA (cytidine(1402)-2'-O)-methyltransferase [Meridianimarinicoccus sp. RP-17]|uniref:16S rRNA (cytidine(1402)-2'-O)-methyltransferase n=1 Tax=Meridianimarinicoccus zhengii TaxID=2056810 RepID=UPI000DAE8FB4|nr:16S rRNA (cytidine(1402)-2'-O)-methyltransferase [Phycocomes zhengii]